MKKNISRNPLWPDWYNGKKIDEVQFGRAFLEQWPLKCVNGTLYTLDGPVEDESEIKQRILENIEEYVTSGLSKKVTNILETIKLLAFSDPFPIEQDCIHLQNGVYHLPDGSFQESRLFCQNRLPVRYDPKAASPDRWLTFLHELLDDADIPTLQEYLGYCLIPSTKGQKMMLIVGKGGEGKSRIGLVLKRLMGDAASNGSVQKVENNRFARADLERRLLMIDDDMDMNALPKTNYIKTIVTAEAKLDLERKGVQSYQRDIYARFLCFGNGALTSLYDHSDGFFRRQLILTTKDKPADRTDDPFLVEKMCAELEGILLWCLEGLHRLVQNDFRFTVSERAAANVDTIKRSSNNVIDFMESEGYFRFKADYSISSKEFYDIYKQWCEDNPDIIPQRTAWNIHFKKPTASYTDLFSQLETAGTISTRGLKPDATHYCELVFDVNSAYFDNHGGYEFAKQFYEDAYKAAVQIVGGEQYILSAVMHADEINRAMTEALGREVYHYHLHVVYVPVVEKQILWSKRCKDKALVGTVKETVMQVSRSKKWASKPLLDDAGKPVLQKSGKPVLKKSYSVLQDDFFHYMRNAGYTDVERGERGSTEEHLTVTQFKVQREQERLDTLTAQIDQKEQHLTQTNKTLSKTEKELAAVQKKVTLTKEALIHARDLDYIGKRTFLGNYSLTEEEFSKLKKQADHGYMIDVENRRLKEELSTAKKEAVRWSNKYHDLWYDVKPYLDALHRAPELVRGFLEKILAPKQEHTMNVPQQNRRRGQDMEL